MLNKIAAGVVCALVAGVASAADWGFDDWDVDGDRLINEQEYNARIGDSGIEAFPSMDLDDNALLDESEWQEAGSTVRLEDWDRDGDAALSEEEFNAGLYRQADADDDGFLDEEEWTTDTELFED